MQYIKSHASATVVILGYRVNSQELLIEVKDSIYKTEYTYIALHGPLSPSSRKHINGIPNIANAR